MSASICISSILSILDFAAWPFILLFCLCALGYKYIVVLFCCFFLQIGVLVRRIPIFIRAGDRYIIRNRANWPSLICLDSWRVPPYRKPTYSQRDLVWIGIIQAAARDTNPDRSDLRSTLAHVAAAATTIAVLVLASGVAFGWSVWPLWLAKLLPHAEWVSNVKDRYNPTITSNLTSIGVNLPIARTVQACVAALVAVIIWVCFRRGVTILATAALLVGTFLATPYAIAYDMPMLTNAVLAVLHDRDQTNRSLTIPEILVLALALLLPLIMVLTWRLSMIRSIPLILLFGLIVWRIFGLHGNVSNSGSVHSDKRLRAG
jgi:hypothetical protein